MLKIYDTLAKKKRVFKPLKKKAVLMYSCGPTVYNYVHLGNLRAYVFVDFLKRYLKYSGYKVNHVMNITDVEDKIIRDSQKSGKTLKEFTEFYRVAFIKDTELLNIQGADTMPKATDYIRQMIKITKRLLKRGYAYKAEDGSIYFRISKAKNYGQLAGFKKMELKENAEGRLNLADEYKKEEVNDFVLWKAWRPEDGNVYWETELGKGRPGWHIECSAMSMALLGKTLDIHCGGIDLIFPHHTNEIAQSESFSGKKFVNYWLHNAHLLVDGQKMSKSLNNFYTLRDVIEKGYNPLLLRFILLKTHYRQILDFNFNYFAEAENIAQKIVNFLVNLDFVERMDSRRSLPRTMIRGGSPSVPAWADDRDKSGNNDGDGRKNDKINKLINIARKKFQKAMDDDLNISRALAALFDFMAKSNKSMLSINAGQSKQIKDFIFEIDGVFGFIESLYLSYAAQLSEKTQGLDIAGLLFKREVARKAGDFQTADDIRRNIESHGLAIEDIKGGGYILKLWE